jgi:hypothetical protein
VVAGASALALVFLGSISSSLLPTPAPSLWCACRPPSVRVSGHAGEAVASPSPREERYWLIERRCKDLCLYLDVLTRNMPRYEKYVLSAKMREIGYLCLELAIAANKKQHKKTDRDESVRVRLKAR